MKCLFIFTTMSSGFLTHYSDWWIRLSGMVLWPLVIAESCSCVCLLVDLYERLEEHQRAGWTKVFVGWNFRILPSPAYGAFSLTLKFIWKHVTSAPTDAWLSFILVKVKPDLFTVCPDSCHVSSNAQVPIILELYNHLDTWGYFGIWEMVQSYWVAGVARHYLGLFLGEGTCENYHEN